MKWLFLILTGIFMFLFHDAIYGHTDFMAVGFQIEMSKRPLFWLGVNALLSSGISGVICSLVWWHFG